MNELIIERGQELGRKLRDLEAEISAWVDELPAGRPETTDAQVHADAAIRQLQQARVDLGVFVQIAAEREVEHREPEPEPRAPKSVEDGPRHRDRLRRTAWSTSRSRLRSVSRSIADASRALEAATRRSVSARCASH